MRYISLLLLIPMILSCKKDKVDPTSEEPLTLTNGMLVLNEGLFQQNNSSISWASFATNNVQNQYFQSRTNRSLGDTGNDIQRYGGKVYVVVNVSSTVEVLDAKTFESIKQIEMKVGTAPKQPRYITFAGSKAYVSCYDGYVDVIDTTSLEVELRILVGANPEAMTIANGKLYVANSGGLNFPQMDSTVSVIDLASNMELEKLTVGINPGSVIRDQAGDVYVISRGDYGAIPSRLYRIDTQQDSVVANFNFDVTSICSFEDNFLIANQDMSSGSSSIGLFDPASESMVNPNYINTTSVSTLYAIQYNPNDQRIYVCDALNYTNTGYVKSFSNTGTYLTEYHVGLIPTKMIFYE